MQDALIVRGAREHNLKNISLTLPRNKLIVFTGLSGSGKSSLAFDTIFAEEQRRYVESLSSYARQFLGQMEKPDVDAIEGLSPAISIDQKSTGHNPRSTVGTVTEIHDYLRLLYARVGIPHCPQCGKEIRQQTVDQMVDAIMAMPDDTRLMILSPVVRARKGEHRKLLEDAAKAGFVRVMIDGTVHDLDDTPVLDKKKKHDIDLVIDRIIKREDMARRLSDSIETALRESGGLMAVQIMPEGERMMFSQNYACPECGINIEELTPRMFSFNSPYGACPECSGLGSVRNITADMVIPDMGKSLNEGAVNAMGWNSSGDERSTSHMMFVGLSEHYHFSMDTPVAELPRKILDIILYGSKGVRIPIRFTSINGEGTYKITYEGIIPTLMRRYQETTSDTAKAMYEQFMREDPCPACQGKRLKPEALAVTVGGMNLSDLSDMTLTDGRAFLSSLALSDTHRRIAQQILNEINVRMALLCDVGLDYLSLSRAAPPCQAAKPSASAWPPRLAPAWWGCFTFLDEPSIGLHQRDNNRLLNTLKSLRDLGNTLIVVEHDEDTLRAADYLVDIGPGAGEMGGQVVAQGSVQDLMDAPSPSPGIIWLDASTSPSPKSGGRPPAG